MRVQRFKGSAIWNPTIEEQQHLATANKTFARTMLVRYYSEEMRLALGCGTTMEEESRLRVKRAGKPAFRVEVERPSVQQVLMALQLCALQLAQYRAVDLGQEALASIGWVAADAAASFCSIDVKGCSLMHLVAYDETFYIGASRPRSIRVVTGSKRIEAARDLFAAHKMVLMRMLFPSQNDAYDVKREIRARSVLGLGAYATCPLVRLESIMHQHVGTLLASRKAAAMGAFAALPLSHRVRVGVFRYHTLGLFTTAIQNTTALNHVTRTMPTEENPLHESWTRWCTRNALPAVSVLLQLASSLAEQELGTSDVRTLEFASPSLAWVTRGVCPVPPSPISSNGHPSLWGSLTRDWAPLPPVMDWSIVEGALWEMLLDPGIATHFTVAPVECTWCVSRPLAFLLDNIETSLRLIYESDEDIARVRSVYAGTFWWLHHARGIVNVGACVCEEIV